MFTDDSFKIEIIIVFFFVFHGFDARPDQEVYRVDQQPDTQHRKYETPSVIYFS